MSIRSEIASQVARVAQEQGKPLAPLTDELPLLDSGLDSLCFAILVARLEEVFGVDPFATSEDAVFPTTYGEFVRLYESVGA
jgi:acyl carrier protein